MYTTMVTQAEVYIMRLYKCAALLLLAGLFTIGAPLVAQQGQQLDLQVLEDTAAVQEIVLRDGTKLVGRVVAIAGDRIDFRTTGGVDIPLQRADIARARIIRGVRRGSDFWRSDPSDSRLFAGPTGRVPPNGHGYFGVYELVVPSFAVGIGDIAMISGGMSIVPGIAIDEQVFFISPKVQVFNTQYAQGAVGALFVQPGDSDESGGLAFGTVTAGDAAASFTGGLAFAFASGSGFEDNAVFLLGGEVRVSRSLKLMIENWVLPNKKSLLNLEFQIIANNVTVEAAAATSSDGGFLPLVNFSVGWGR